MVKRSVHGVTLIETIVVVAILGLVFSIWPQIMKQSIVFLGMHRARLETNRDARNSMEIVISKLRQASASSITVDRAPLQPPYSRIRFFIGGSENVFWQEGVRFMMSENGNEHLLSENLRTVNFTYPDLLKPNLIAVSIAMEKRVLSKRAGDVKAVRLAAEKVRIQNL
jgi:prepilin-type N-terminal cleavage/methylation domain-containing protein